MNWLIIYLLGSIWLGCAFIWLLWIYPEQVDELPVWYTRHIATDDPYQDKDITG